jgi:Cu(I)/Ag(I) efflux system membrane fusion protein
VAADERRIGVVNPKFEGWIEKLLVNTTGQTVRRGEALLEVYSPDLVLAQREYLVARSAAADMAQADAMARDNANAIAIAALSRLKNWDISADQLARLQRSGVAKRTLTLNAPIGGIVMDKPALQGLHFGAGDMLYRIVDLSAVWLLADVFEQDLAQIRPGQSATITVQAYPGRVFEGRVAFVYPTVNAQTRTAKVRIEVPNPDLLLKTDMYATVEIAAPAESAMVLAVPDSAVLDTGTRQTVLVDRDEGRFEPRMVKLGPPSCSQDVTRPIDQDPTRGSPRGYCNDRSDCARTMRPSARRPPEPRPGLHSARPQSTACGRGQRWKSGGSARVHCRRGCGTNGSRRSQADVAAITRRALSWCDADADYPL